MREMRLLLYQLRESGQEKDIATSLDNRFQQVENRLGIKASLEMDDGLYLPTEIQHQVWRILVESLNNAVKHANASSVQVHITCDGQIFSVSTQDNGIGFDVEKSSPGMGLKNIQKRAESLGGHVEIISEIGKGTQIIVRIPTSCMKPEEME
jgi:two-component system NarL family sensor kinase